MKTFNFPYIALALGSLLMLVVMVGSDSGSDGSSLLPLSTLLLVSEFAFFVTGTGAYIGIKHIMSNGIKPVYTTVSALCFLLSARFVFLGVALWPS